MGPVNIRVDGQSVLYLPAGVPVATKEVGLVAGLEPAEDALLLDHPRIRRVLTRVPRSAPWHFNLLQWNDGTDLDAFDKRVAAGEATDADFDAAILLEPMWVHCMGCGAGLRALVVDPARVMLGRRLAQRLRGQRHATPCPACRLGLPSTVVELMPRVR
jgi:hypothetical protein